MEKKNWTKPQLIVLGKGKPEESVLKNCKYHFGLAGGPNAAGCRGGGNQGKGACQGLGHS